MGRSTFWLLDGLESKVIGVWRFSAPLATDLFAVETGFHDNEILACQGNRKVAVDMTLKKI